MSEIHSAKPHLETAWRRTHLAAAAALLLGLAALATPRLAVAQASDDLQREMSALADAFQAVADDASTGAWATADDDYNRALDRLDAIKRRSPAVPPELGQALQEVEGHLTALESAMDDEDVARARTAIGLIKAALAKFVPGVPTSASPPQLVELLLGWQNQVQVILTLAGGQAWRDMRNTAIALADSADANRARLGQAFGSRALADTSRLALLALRLREAALSQSLAAAQPAADAADGEITDLLRLSGALPTPAAPPSASAFHFAAGHGAGEIGQPVIITVSAADIPATGLGGFVVRARYSPGALRLDDVAWRPSIGLGSVQRNDAAGMAELSLPAAPRGPRGNADLVDLHFTVRSAVVQAAAYLPAGELTALQSAMGRATDLVKVGDLPKAADALAAPYYALLAGRHRDDSLYHELDRFGLASGLEASLFKALDLATRASGTDLMVVALDELGATFETVLKGYMARLADLPGVPVDIVVISAQDTTGASLRAGESEPGLVLVPGASIVLGSAGGAAISSAAEQAAAAPQGPGADATIAAISTAAASAPTPAASALRPSNSGSLVEPLRGATAGADSGTAPAAARREQRPTGPPVFPRTLVIAVLAALLAGVAAVLWSSRQGEAES